MDVEVLLQGVEKLQAVFGVRGVPERVVGIKGRWGRVKDSVAFYERRVEKLGRGVEGRGGRWGGDGDDEGMEEVEMEEESEVEVTDEDLRREEEEIRELERRKRELEERVHGMSRDLEGLLG